MSLARDLAWQYMNERNRTSMSYQLARYALSLKYDLLPPEVAHQAKRCLLDALGCAVGAYEAPGLAAVMASAREIGGVAEATAFGSGLRTTALNATLINSFLVRFLDYNDIGGGGHNSDSISSIIAVAEREKKGGPDLLTSVVCSYELGGRFRETTTILNFEENGWCGDVRGGVTMPPTLGRMMSMNEEQIANAIGICASRSLPLGVLDAHREEPSMCKNLRLGFVCYDAILACIMARNGYTGPVRVIEGEGGMREVIFRNDMNLEKLIDFSGWRILKVRHKFIAANGGTMPHLLATLALVKEHDLKPEDIKAVRIRTSQREINHATYAAKKYPRNAESADHSAYFAEAIAIKERTFGPDQVRPEKFTDPVVLDLIERITVEREPAFGERSYRVISEITTKDGHRFEKQIDNPHGLGNDPLTDAELETKFRDMAARYMPEKQIKQIFDTIWNLEKVDDVGKLTGLMIFPARSRAKKSR